MSVPKVGTWAQRERRLIVEWANARHPNARKMFNVPLGKVPESLREEVGLEEAAKIFRPWLYKIDAVIVYPDKAIFAEAELLRPKESIRDLLFYMQIVNESLHLGEILNLPRVFVLVIPEHLKFVETYAKNLGIEVDIFTPDWVKEYLEEMGKYWTKEGILERMERKRRLMRP